MGLHLFLYIYIYIIVYDIYLINTLRFIFYEFRKRVIGLFIFFNDLANLSSCLCINYWLEGVGYLTCTRGRILIKNPELSLELPISLWICTRIHKDHSLSDWIRIGPNGSLSEDPLNSCSACLPTLC